MRKYYLSNKAKDDLSNIWDYTFQTWSENQADKYYFELLDTCQELADNQKNGRNYYEIDTTIFGLKSGQHIVFYRILEPTKIEILRILHSKMDLKNRFSE